MCYFKKKSSVILIMKLTGAKSGKGQPFLSPAPPKNLGWAYSLLRPLPSLKQSSPTCTEIR